MADQIHVPLVQWYLYLVSDAPPWPDNVPDGPSIICAVAQSDCPRDRRMWQKAKLLETERQARPSGDSSITLVVKRDTGI